DDRAVVHHRRLEPQADLRPVLVVELVPVAALDRARERLRLLPRQRAVELALRRRPEPDDRRDDREDQERRRLPQAHAPRTHTRTALRLPLTVSTSTPSRNVIQYLSPYFAASDGGIATSSGPPSRAGTGARSSPARVTTSTSSARSAMSSSSGAFAS